MTTSRDSHIIPPPPDFVVAGIHRESVSGRYKVFHYAEGNRCSFSVYQAQDSLNPENSLLADLIQTHRSNKSRPVLIILDPEVDKIYSPAIISYLDNLQIKHSIIRFKSRAYNEQNKSFQSLGKMARELRELGIRRGDLVVVFGGGVAIDLIGTVCATYRRGQLKILPVPTTLIGMVDAAISPKTAVNVDFYKNLLGVYYPPVAVLVDTKFLCTASRDSLLDGVTELLKVAIVGDKLYFAELEQHLQEALRSNFQDVRSQQLVERGIGLFLGLRFDERFPKKKNSIRSFGHGFSREIEELSQFNLTHGEAVALEARIAVQLSVDLGHLQPDEGERILALFDHLGLAPYSISLNGEKLWDMVLADDYEEGEDFAFPAVAEIGLGFFLEAFTREDLMRAMETCRERAGGRTLR